MKKADTIKRAQEKRKGFTKSLIFGRFLIFFIMSLTNCSERYLKEHLGSDTKLRPKARKAEVADLTAQKDRLYLEVCKLKEEVAEAETVRRCGEQAIPLAEQRKEKSKTQDISL